MASSVPWLPLLAHPGPDVNALLLQMLLALVPAGSHIVTTTDCYFGTRQFIQTARRLLLAAWLLAAA